MPHQNRHCVEIINRIYLSRLYEMKTVEGGYRGKLHQQNGRQPLLRVIYQDWDVCIDLFRRN